MPRSAFGVKAKIFVGKWVCQHKDSVGVKGGYKQYRRCGKKNVLFLSIYSDGIVRRSGSFCQHYKLCGVKEGMNVSLQILKYDCLTRVRAEKEKIERIIDFLERRQVARERVEALG
jgi:hypothetical protein